MSRTYRNTVDRLDKPSSYAASKVRSLSIRPLPGSSSLVVQNKKRKRYDDREEEREKREKTPEWEDKLKNATTLYVGNL